MPRILLVTQLLIPVLTSTTADVAHCSTSILPHPLLLPCLIISSSLSSLQFQSFKNIAEYVEFDLIAETMQ